MPLHNGKPGFSPAVMKAAYSTICNEIIEDVMMDLCFKIHRAVKFDYFPLDDYVIPKDGNFIVYDPSLPEHNQSHEALALAASSKKPSHINCPHCKRKLGTNRFAPHLNSCMGEGGRQNKDRTAKRNCLTYDSDEDDDSDSGKKKKRKPGKNSPRRLPKFKGKSIQIKEFLNQKCGVSARKSKAMCNNTLKCAIHTDEQRREVRRTLLKCEPDTNAHIDVDTVDEGSRSPSPGELSLCSSSTSALNVKLEDVCSTSELPESFLHLPNLY